MSILLSETEKHYYRLNLYNDIVDRLQKLGVDLSKTTREDIQAVDEFHVRGAQVSKELADCIKLKGVKVLDVGCGIGGPCRMLADEYNCEVTGIDLSHEFIDTAQKLSVLTGFNGTTKFVQGNACNLPFEDNSFDVVWTQHVQMNVLDKATFYAEIYRVLKPNGTFLYYDILKGNDVPIDYPMPWANNSDISFLAKSEEIESLLWELNFEKVRFTNQTKPGIEFFEKLVQNIAQNGPPKLGLNVLMGETTKAKIMNLLTGLKEERILLQSGVYKKSI
jgi:ubiquinone/menaquinone biosynthesis C-methylase UbiE